MDTSSRINPSVAPLEVEREAHRHILLPYGKYDRFNYY